MKIRTLILFFGLLAGFYCNAQVVSPPHLACVSVDNNGDVVLNWSNPTVACGTFNAYYIYRSFLIGGPYAQVAVINNQFQTTYTDGVGNGGIFTYYYYMVSDFACLGFTFPTSDTLDNLDPFAPEINYVTVTNNLAEINWQPSISPEAFGYIIYRVINNNYNPIDTVYGNVTDYTDLNSTPSTDSMSYTIATIDSCINTGLINEKPQHTIFLEDTVIRCTHTVYLNWTPYNHWQDGVAGYDVYVAKNGGASTLYHSLPKDSVIYNISDLNDGDQVCIKIIATEKTTGFTSESNEVCFTLNVVQPAKDFYVRNVTVVGNDSIEVSFSMNSLADITSIVVQRSLDSINFSLLKKIVVPADLSITNTYLDLTPLTGELSYYYRLIATDSCGTVDTSTMGKSILLKGYAFSDLTFYNNWDASNFDFGNVLNYLLYRDDGTGYNLVNTLADDVFSYQEKNIATTTPCYFLESKNLMVFPNGTTETILSRSNKLCLNQPSQIYMPTAFAPQGQNNIFIPILNVQEVNNYSFYVFNRWGEQLFYSTDPSQGWNGKKDGAYIQQGVYAYTVSLTDEKGLLVSAKGTVMLVR